MVRRDLTRMTSPGHRPLTFEEYLRLEESSPTRHELVGGVMHAMNGATRRHARIVMNISVRLATIARGGPCQVIATDVKLRAAREVVYYPDVMVACGPHDDNDIVVDDPCLVVEVTSPSTARTDRREKLAASRQIASLRAYLIVNQRVRRVERHWRDDGGDWWHATIEGDGRVPIPCLDTELALDEIYEGLQPLAVAEPEDEAALYEI
jgi:Uma2 family endonuclease